MVKTILILFLIGGLSACKSASIPSQTAAAPADYFPQMRGCFLLYNVKSQTFEKVIGEEACRERRPACSTFKVPLAVMAFDSGVLKDENQILKWDGKKRERAELDQDQNAKSWMKYSVVWFSQKLTPKIGMRKIKKYLHDFGYGSEDMSSGLTMAWLVAPWQKKSALSISAYEQVEFMKKLWAGGLPVSDRAMHLTREITFLETSAKGFNLSGKTGSNFMDSQRTRNFGWFIAHLQRNDQEYIAVTNIQDLAASTAVVPGGLQAKRITLEILRDQGLW